MNLQISNTDINHNDYFISTDPSLLDIKVIWKLLKTCFWSKNIPVEYIEKFIKYSLCFGLYQKKDPKLIGFGRVITDYTTYAYICDVFILSAHRRKKLATWLMKTILNDPRLRGLKTWSLTTTEESRSIYEKFGFKLPLNPKNNLEINDLDIYTKDNFVNLYKDQ